jgi:hypothetical protein
MTPLIGMMVLMGMMSAGLAAGTLAGAVSERVRLTKALRMFTAKNQSFELESNSSGKQIELSIQKLQPQLVSNLNEARQVLVNSSFPAHLKTKSSTLLASLEEIYSAGTVEVEDNHNLLLIADQLASSVRLYETLTAKARKEHTVVAEIAEQLDILVNATEEIKAGRNEDAVRELKISTDFLRVKFLQDQQLKLR